MKKKKPAKKPAKQKRKIRRPTTKAARELEQQDAPPIVMCNERELAFIDYYLGEARFNGSLAIRLAGIHDNPLVAKVYASEWLNREHVILEITRRRDERKKQMEATTARLLEEQLNVALANIGDVMTWDDLSARMRPESELPDEIKAAIQSVDVHVTETRKDARIGKDGSVLRPAEVTRVINHTVRMHPKLDAIAALQKQLEPPAALQRRGVGAAGDGAGVTIIVDGGATGLEVTIKPEEEAA